MLLLGDRRALDEMEVLFAFLAERYERRTVIITSNVVFREWDRIFMEARSSARSRCAVCPPLTAHVTARGA